MFPSTSKLQSYTSCQVSSRLQCSSTGLRLSRGESNSFSFQSVIREGGVKEYDFLSLSQLPASVALDGGNIHFSSVLAQVRLFIWIFWHILSHFLKQSQQQPVHSPPLLDFLRHHFVYNLGRWSSCQEQLHQSCKFLFRRGNPPLLRNNLCVVLWRTLGPNPSFGHTVVEIVDQDQTHEIENKEVVKEKLLPSYPVTALAEVREVVMHDFAATPLACVPVKVKMMDQNTNDEKSNSGGVLVQYCLGAQERGARVAGATAGLGWVTPSITLDLELGVSVARYYTEKDVSSTNALWTFSRPGLYSMRNWQFRAVKLDTCDMNYDQWGTGDIFVPLEVTFEVRQIWHDANWKRCFCLWKLCKLVPGWDAAPVGAIVPDEISSILQCEVEIWNFTFEAVPSLDSSRGKISELWFISSPVKTGLERQVSSLPRNKFHQNAQFQ